ncbi:sulfate/molybdate ABC transporter ATP-binding protein [Pectinatus haikarae]|uniref:Sulfate transport system ATP-binding protein n=1 Tax=Pectinatus haikarae TaxID=349096 RepID=A0ABT9YD99_9FIRM|nr:sulfate ABC transporter ATP-binding protein [Pectinatus haikarae]MDQ0205004.1 sulfate transport system ATP-binding protein [Pectinatus haikarae]
MYIELKNINKSFGTYKASDDVSFALPAGSLSAFLGPSGSGKTTILRILAGLETPDSGDIIIDGQRVNDITPAKRGIGFVFQNYALFRYMTVFDNIAFGMKIKKISADRIKKRVGELTELIGLKGLENRYPAQLSGGQKQRVAFARAIAPEPKVLLLDEPFAAIDAKIRKELRQWLKDTIKKLNITSIFVTHDQDEASEVADEILIINKGRVEQSGSPLAVYKKPVTPFVAQFIGENSLINNYDKLKGFYRQEGFSTAVIRPEFISIFKENEQYQNSYTAEPGVVKTVTFRGSHLEIVVILHGIELKAVWPTDRELLIPQEKVGVLVKKMYLIDGGNIREIENEALIADNSVII